MTLSQSLKVHLATAIPSVEGRVYPVAGPQDPEFPFIIFRLIESFDETLSHDETAIFTPTFEIQYIAQDYDEARAGGDQVHAALHGFHGQMGGALGVSVGHCLAVTREDQYLEFSDDAGAPEVVSTFRALLNS